MPDAKVSDSWVSNAKCVSKTDVQLRLIPGFLPDVQVTFAWVSRCKMSKCVRCPGAGYLGVRYQGVICAGTRYSVSKVLVS